MTKILIGVPTAEFARQAIFYDFFNQMDKPEGTIITFAHGQSPARNRNIMIEQALANDASHVLFLDDDTCPPKNIIEKLLRHDKDMVSGMYVMRNFPHQPIIFDYADERGHCLHALPVDGSEEIFPIVASGLGALLINIRVFRGMERPWITMGELEKDHWCDDISFWKRAREAGFIGYCDPTVRCGHMATVTLTPEFLDGKWMVSYDTGGTSKVTIPMVKKALHDSAVGTA